PRCHPRSPLFPYTTLFRSWNESDAYDGEAFAEGALDVAHVTVVAPKRPGTYWIRIGTWWPEGDIAHVFKVNVIGTHDANDKGSIDRKSTRLNSSHSQISYA